MRRDTFLLLRIPFALSVEWVSIRRPIRTPPILGKSITCAGHLTSNCSTQVRPISSRPIARRRDTRMSCVKITCLRWTALFVLGVQYGIGMAFGVTPQYIATALSNPTRPSADRLRDPARKPDVCLALAGIKPGDRIADVYPGGGYYSRLFSLVVGPQGRVYALVPQVVAARTPQLLAYTRSQFGDPAYHNVEVLETPL